jgi:hypothetical protein
VRATLVRRSYSCDILFCSNSEWAHRRIDVHANCKLGCQSRINRGTTLATCSTYCFTELNPTIRIVGEANAGFSSQSECEESCLARQHTNSSAPSQSSIASCTSWCTLDMPGMRLDCQTGCEQGCGFFDDCTCPSGTYTSGSGCETCPVGFYCPIPFVSKKPCPAGRYVKHAPPPALLQRVTIFATDMDTRLGWWSLLALENATLASTVPLRLLTSISSRAQQARMVYGKGSQTQLAVGCACRDIIAP